MSEVFKLAEIQDRLYTRIAESLADQGPCPRISKFIAGYGFVDETTDPPTLHSLPADADAVPNPIYEGTPTRSVSDGRMLSLCAIPGDAVSVPTKCTCIGLFDETDALVALASFLPEWLVPGKTYENLVYITFPVQG